MTLKRPEEGVINWNMNTTCNYRCTYCTQRFLDDRGRWAKDVPRFLSAFARLPGRWEIKLSGGEPFRHPKFLDVVNGLRSCGHRVSVVTNFASSEARLLSFLAAADESLRVFSASLHLEYVHDDQKIENFIQKGLLVQSALPKEGSFCVTTVATRPRLSSLATLQERFDQAGLRLKIQPEKQARDVIAYSADEVVELKRLGGHNNTGNIAANFLGQPCLAGARYFILDDLGNAFRCYPARRYKKESLGNFLNDDFSLNEEAHPCRYSYCNCTVPIERGMMNPLSARDAFGSVQ